MMESRKWGGRHHIDNAKAIHVERFYVCAFLPFPLMLQGSHA